MNFITTEDYLVYLIEFKKYRVTPNLNSILQSLFDVRDWLLAADFSAFNPQSAAPVVPRGVSGTLLWVRESDDHLIYTYNGTDVDLLAGVGTGGITQLTGDVIAGPGTGSQPSTVVALQGQSVTAASSAGEYLRYDGAGWVPTAVLGGTTADLSAGDGTTVTLGTGLSLLGGVLTASGSGGTVTGVTASAPLASSGGATPDISLTGIVDVANGGTGLSTVSAAGNILVAQTSSTLSSVPVSGDATLATSGALTVTGLQTNPVSASAPTAGQFLGWTGAAWAPADVTGGGGGFGPGFVYYLEYGTAATSPPPSLATAKLMDFSYSTDPQSSTGNVTVPDSTTQQELATFLADTGTPGDATIPAGLWDLALYCHSSGAADETSFRFLVQVWDGTTLTTIATSDDTYITGVASVTQQYTASAFVPLTDLTATDRLVIRIEGRRWVSNSHSIHSFFQGATISHAHTTLTAPGGTGLVKVLNGVIQTPASLLVDADVDNAAAIAQSKIANLTTDLANKVDGSIAANEVAFGTGVNTVGGDSRLTWNSGTGQFAVDTTVGTQALVVQDTGVSVVASVQAGQFRQESGFDKATLSAVGSVELKLEADTAGGFIPTITSQNELAAAYPLNLAIGELQVNSAPGASGEVLTSQGAGLPPVWAAAGGSSFGSKVFLVVEGGSYATLQAAVDVASANDVILVGPKATGDWGNVTLNVTNKNLIIAALSGAGSNKIVKVGSITYDLGTTGPVLNVNLNEVYLYGLYIQGSFAGGSAVTLTGGASYPGRLRLFGCYVLNSSATGTAAVTNSNSGANSSIYLDNCVVSLTPSTTGSAIVQTAGYTVIRNRTEISGSAAVGATGYAINVSAGTMEIYDSFVELARAVPTVNITGATTFVSAGYSTIKNSSNAAGASCVYIGTSGATFGAGDATLAAGSTLPTSAVAVSGVAGGSFLYANVSFGYTTTVSTVTATATSQSGGLFAYGMSVGSALGTTFAVNASGNITKINNVTTSFPSVQGSANQVLTNNGSGTLTWANGNQVTLGSVGAAPTAANLRTNATYTVAVAAVALPAMAAGDDGLTVSLVNISGANSTVTPSTGVARTMSTGGGQIWVWRNTGTSWFCISNV